MRVLISNDDGVFAPGINRLAKELSTFVDIEVVAPDRNRSGSSNSLTLSRPLKAKKLDNGYYSVEGTPTDCVHLAVTGFLDTEFDMVVSGINDGANLGDDILYSGTVAAAMEGRYLGLPALAFSMVGDNIQHYDTAAVIAKYLVMKLSTHRLPSQTILNINVPDMPLDKIKGLQVTRLGTRHGAEPVVKDKDPRGRSIYWIGLPGAEADAGPGTDFYAISEGYVSITPLHLDMTNYKMFDQLANWLDGIRIQ
ncbi:5'/3'-nucleotidase SurE [Legionella tucsonensis]|uniref:5'-nucleotidase SurE n=1 Tax=Legionella tucsonensis TaxID=40335 RepID=A0A0W0ZWW6_9GAMM|nr:5'/3'-nucleotidase SurE [Legionella tucsonensis]KTD73582.1 Acid phosphatase SurE (Stationary phase survival protein) [Legionella tucsonensis]